MTGLISDYLRPVRRSSSEFLPNALIRRRAFASAMTVPPTITALGTTAATATDLGNGSGTVLKTLPTELRASNLPVFVPAARSDYESVLPYGANGDHSLSPRSRGFQNVRWETDFTGRYFSFSVSNAGFKYRLWVNEQPASLLPTTIASTGDTRHYLVDLGAAASLANPWRLMLELESGGLVQLNHLSSDFFVPSSLTARGRLIVLGDSIPQGTWASPADVTTNVSYSHGAFVHDLGWLLGLWDVWQGLSLGGRGFCQVNATNGNDTYLGNIVNDIIPYASHPTGKGMCVALQTSTNDTPSAGWTSLQRQAAMRLAIQTLQDALPDCLVFMFGTVGIPYNSVWDVLNTDAKAACDAQGVGFIDTTGKITPGSRAIFTGTGSEGTGVNGTGNADQYAPQDDNVNFPGKGTPHPNPRGHRHIARSLAPGFAREMGINIVADGVRVV